MIDRASRVFIIGSRESPATVLFGVCFDYAHRKERLEAFEFARDDDTVGEGAEEADLRIDY